MRLALIQPHAAGGCPDRALDALAQAMDAARAGGADMLLAPELMLPGYNCPQAHAALTQPQGGAWSMALAALAREAQCALVVGWSERAGARCYNSATAFGPDGAILAHHRKRLLFGDMERAVFARGAGRPVTFSHAGRRFGLLICYEIEFPEAARQVARHGAEVILVPTANPAGFEHVQSILIPARAHENRAFVAYANYCGTENGLAFGGRSVIAGPDGKTLAAAGVAPAVLICDLPRVSDYAQALLSTQLDELDLLQEDDSP